MDGGAWWATVHGVAKRRTRLSRFTTINAGTVAARGIFLVAFIRTLVIVMDTSVGVNAIVVMVGIVASAAVAIDAAVVVMQVGIVTVAAVLIVAALGVAVAKSTVVVKGVSTAVASGILMLPVVPFAVAYVVAGAIIVATVAIGMVVLGRTVVAVAEVQTMRSVEWQ